MPNYFERLKTAVRYLNLDSRDFVTFSSDEWALWFFLRKGQQGSTLCFIREILDITQYLGTDQKQFAELSSDERLIDDLRRSCLTEISSILNGRNRNQYAA